ncbi:Fic family protein [Candidatus Microgenomates bacterium]|nr:Fic family protein [Candidatus Microgenomates bacterium]
MNDTILTTRQKYILNVINQSEGLLREEIQEKVSKLYPVSKPTVIRDIHVLLIKKLVSVTGKARATIYFSKVQNPLLREFNLERYFADDPDNRIGARKSFDFEIFKNLHDLLTPEEINTLEKVALSFREQTMKLSPDLLKRELERFVIELSWKSSKIEGNTYTLLETESLIKEQKEAAGKSKDEAMMILNHKAAFEEILKAKNDFKTISVSGINQLHNILTKGLGISSGIRKQAVGITGTTYHPLDNEHQTKEVFEKTINVVNKVKSPFEKALIVHFMMPYIQPYADGNKRTARMLTNAILLAYDLYPLSYRSVDEDEFKKALILFYEQESIYEIKKLFIEQIKFANETYFR